jgi:hypothetical protein
MEAMTIRLSRNQSEQDWSVELDGKLHDHISTRDLDDLVEYALVVVQQSLLESETSAVETDSIAVPSD